MLKLYPFYLENHRPCRVAARSESNLRRACTCCHLIGTVAQCFPCFFTKTVVKACGHFPTKGKHLAEIIRKNRAHTCLRVIKVAALQIGKATAAHHANPTAGKS